MLKIIGSLMTVILIITNICGNRAQKEKHVTDWLVFGRLSSFFLLTVSIIHLIWRWPSWWWANILWTIYLLLIYILLEIVFRLKRETFGNPYRSYLLTFLLVVNLLIILFFL